MTARMNEVIVPTTGGQVQGTTIEGVHTFLGIPYGGDTGGANRFGPPPAVTPWTGVRPATSYGPSAPQPQSPEAGAMMSTFGGMLEPSLGEDCLVLNVWTPDTEPSPAGRPVLVYFHGGGHTSGSGSWPAYDGAALARQGDAVVVTVNHRLGLLGYLYLAELGGDRYATSGVNGILDLVAALEWVRDNVAGFGGDPSSVLAYGESGGGWKTSALLAMPAARGLHRTACLMSGHGSRCMSTDEATALAERTLSFLGLDASRIGELDDVPVERLLEAQNAAGIAGFAPVADGVHIPGNPLDLLRSRQGPDVPLLVGTTRDEFLTFALQLPQPDQPADDAWLVGHLAGIAGDAAGKLVAGYRAERPEASTRDLEMAIMTDQHMRIGSIRMAEAAATTGSAGTYMYRFDWESPALGGILKAGHGVDYPFFFGNLDTDVVTSEGPGRAELAARMTEALLAFARTGDPNHDGLPEWPRYDTDRRATMIFDRTCRVVDDPDGAERALWTDLP